MLRAKGYFRQCFARYELLVNDYSSRCLGCKTRWQDNPTALAEHNATDIRTAGISEDGQMEMNFSSFATTGRISQNITSGSVVTVCPDTQFLTVSFIWNFNITVLSGKRDKEIKALTFEEGHSVCRTSAWVSGQKTVNSWCYLTHS